MTEQQALNIIEQILKDRKQWGESAGIRVAQFELVNALLVLEARFGEIVTKDELTTEKRRYTAMNAQYAKAIKDSARMRKQRDAERKKHTRSAGDAPNADES
jgi:hypothetical protein